MIDRCPSSIDETASLNELVVGYGRKRTMINLAFVSLVRQARVEVNTFAIYCAPFRSRCVGLGTERGMCECW